LDNRDFVEREDGKGVAWGGGCQKEGLGRGWGIMKESEEEKRSAAHSSSVVVDRGINVGSNGAVEFVLRPKRLDEILFYLIEIRGLVGSQALERIARIAEEVKEEVGPAAHNDELREPAVATGDAAGEVAELDAHVEHGLPAARC
jgi:hypothetical protein